MIERDDFLREMAAAQDELIQRGSVLAGEKERLRAELAPKVSPARRVLLPAFIALGAVTAGLLVLVTSARPALTFAVGKARLTGEVGAAIIAPEANSIELRFSDGSLLALGPSGRGRVTVLHERGASVLVERGHAEVSVVPRKNGRWRVDVGPFAIHVKGTRFSFDWDPASELLSFHLQTGTVEITAPCLDGGRSLGAGESLRVSCRPSQAQASVPPASEVQAVPVLEPSPQEREPPPPPRAVPVWQKLAGTHDYRGALDAALARGFEAECRRASPADLLLLGDVARLAGDPDHALHAYGAARKKRDEAGRSAFALGLIEFDHRQHYRRAAEWFALYIREQPRGALVEEAEGRLIEAWQRAGEVAKAKEAAEAYLARHSAGQYVDLALRTMRAE